MRAMANTRMETKLRVLTDVHLCAAACVNKRAAYVNVRTAMCACRHAEREAV